MEQVSSPGSASSTLLEEHHGDEDDEYDEDDATEETEIQSCDHEEVPIETVVPPNRPSTSTYDAIVASEGKIVDAENRRHSDMMTVLERMIGLQEETVSQLAHLHRVFIEVPKQLQKINTSFEALVVQQTQANYWRMTNVPQFNTSQPGSVHAGQFSPHSSDIHSPGPNVTGQVADIAVQVPDDILPLPSVQIQQQTPTKEATKTKQDTHETDQPSLVQCLPTCSHVSLGTSPVREQSLPKSPVGESLPKSPVGESLPKSPVGYSRIAMAAASQSAYRLDRCVTHPMVYHHKEGGYSPAAVLAGLDTTSSNLSALPTEYHEYLDVFNKVQAEFIHNFSTIALPITALTKKGADLTTWSPKAIEAFEFLKKAFVTAPILRHPDTSLPFTLEVDASDVGAGAVLSQRSTPQEKLYPCGFFSRKFSSAERNYDVGNRELLAIKLALQEWRHLLEGTKEPIAILTDHKNLLYIEGAR
ncbi:uncharacterized protein LOC142466384 [Ascaphus truei]|uniref:uncharacterized protein LOC142466384 n=1 Tax=Ascaphus truei TaxID=8439 RepID=UPI003F5ACA97